MVYNNSSDIFAPLSFIKKIKHHAYHQTFLQQHGMINKNQPPTNDKIL